MPLSNRCSTKCCRRTATVKGKCKRHRNKELREKNPIRYAYQTLKDNAKRRGKDFSLTFEEFKQFAIETRYIFGKGRSKDSFTIDRIDESKGYHIGNIQILSNSANVKKYQNRKLLKYNHDKRGVPCDFHFEKRTFNDPNFEGVPF